MNAADKLELDTLIDIAGHIPTEVNAATGKAAERLDAKDYAATAKHIDEASKAADKMGAALTEIQKWSDKQKLDVTPPVPGPVPTSFATRAEFDTWAAATQTQAITLDGVLVHAGFGPAMEWFTQPNGTITRDPVVVPGPAPGPGPGPVIPPPAGVVAFAETAGSTAYRHYGRMDPGVTYSFQVAGKQRCDVAVTGSVFVLIGLTPACEAGGGMSASSSVVTPDAGGLVFFKLGDNATGPQTNAILNTLPVT